MKKIISTISMCLFALAMISCGGSTKQATPSGVTKGTNPTPEGMELATNECIELAEASPPPLQTLHWRIPHHWSCWSLQTLH